MCRSPLRVILGRSLIARQARSMRRVQVEVIESGLVHLEHIQGNVGDSRQDTTVAPHFGVIAHPSQQAVGDAGRAARPARHFHGAFRIDLDAENPGRAGNDSAQFLDAVELQALHDTETIPQW